MSRLFRATFLSLFIAPLNFVFAVPTHLPPAIPFYRTPQSPFASGQASRADLEKNLKNQEFHHTYKVSWNHRKYTLEATQLAREIDCANLAYMESNFELLEKPLSSAKSKTLLSKDEEVEILKLDNYWAEVRSLRQNMTGWIPQKKLRLKNDDVGVFVNLIDTFVRKKPDHTSPIVTTIPKAQRLKILGYDNGFLKTQYLSHTGYVDLSHLVSRADFAIWAFHEEHQWVDVSHRENEFLILKDKRKIPLDQITAYGGNPSKAVVIDPDENGPPVRSHVQILSSDAHHWGVSALKGHGLVWWKKENPSLPSKKSDSDLVITAEELLKRPIFSMALEGGKKIKGLVSAQGVFRTEDGVLWYRIPQFGSEDMPVAIHNQGEWFVGSYKSHDRGRTFEPYIRWDHLAQIIESHMGKNPRQIRLQTLKALPGGQMEMMIDTGPGRVKLRYQVASSSWSVEK